MMTRKDFVEVAYALWSERQSGTASDADVSWTAGVLSRAFARCNPRFDRDRFLDAVMGEAMPR